jgi:hypothetical protein
LRSYGATVQNELALAIASSGPDAALAGEADHLIAAVSDAELVDAVATLLAVPRRDDLVDSFVLHSGLELLARSALLPLVPPDARLQARRRIAWLGSTYAHIDAAPPVGAHEPADPERLVAALGDAVDCGDADAAERAAAALVVVVEPADLVRLLADAVVPTLAAAAHGSIALHLLGRCAPRSAVAGGIVRGLARALAAQPGQRLTVRPSDASRDAAGIEEAVAAVVATDPPQSTFILPLVRHGEATARSIVERTVGRDVDLLGARRSILRVAAASMLLDDPEHAPFGWSHALTIPQAVLSIAPMTSDVPAAVAVAVSHLVAFRAGLAGRDVSVGPVLDDRATPSWAQLAASASAHEDAHLAKYTLACMDAACSDRAAALLYRSAAAHLGAWWRDHPGSSFAPDRLARSASRRGETIETGRVVAGGG